MADTIRKKIIQHMLTTLDTIPTLEVAGLGMQNPPKDCKYGVGWIPEEETIEREPDDASLARLNGVMRVTAGEDFDAAALNLEDVLGDVTQALLADCTRGGLALDTIEIGTKWLTLGQGSPTASADLMLQVLYVKSQGDPTE